MQDQEQTLQAQLDTHLQSIEFQTPAGQVAQKAIKELQNKVVGEDVALPYLSLLVLHRQPPMDKTTLTKVVRKLSMMFERDYDHRAGEPKDLILSALHDIAAPSNISQLKTRNCVAACIQIRLALCDPLTYLDMLDTLAQNKTYTTKAGKQIEPNWNFTHEKKKWFGMDSRRPLATAIIQDAIMDYANGAQPFDSQKNIFGLMQWQISKGMNAFSPNRYRIISDGLHNSNNRSWQKLLEEEPSYDNPVLNIMTYGTPDGAAHAVLVVDIDTEEELVTLINPWGRCETMPVAMFRANLLGFMLEVKPRQTQPHAA